MRRIMVMLTVAVGGIFLLLRKSYQLAKKRALERLRSGSKIIETEYGTVEYCIVGRGKPLLVLHGIIGNYEQGRISTNMLEDQPYQRIMISRPGYLRTPSNGASTAAYQADLCAAMLDELGIETVIVMGISGGGPAALEFAKRYNNRCEGLILMGAVSKTLDMYKIQASRVITLLSTARFTDFWAWLLIEGVVLLQPFFALFNKDVDTRLLKDREGQRLFAQLLRSSFPISPLQPGIDNDILQFRSLPVTNLQDIRVPTLILQGTDDVTVPVTQAEYLAQEIPDARLIKVQDAEHAFFITHRDEISSEIIDFIDANTAREPSRDQ